MKLGRDRTSGKVEEKYRRLRSSSTKISQGKEKRKAREGETTVVRSYRKTRYGPLDQCPDRGSTHRR
jgi:hypothetical protein